MESINLRTPLLLILHGIESCYTFVDEVVYSVSQVNPQWN